jgi:hypothetical protein
MSLRLTTEAEKAVALLSKEGARGWLTCVGVCLIPCPPSPNPLLGRGGELFPRE